MTTLREAAQQGATCNIDPTHPSGLVPAPELPSITCQLGGKLWCVMHKPTGTLLHIRINDADGNLLFTAPDNLDWWIGRDEAQTKAQAAALGDDFVAAFFVCTGEGDKMSPTLS